MKKILCALGISMLLFTACSPQYMKIAKHYVQTGGDTLAIMIYPPATGNIMYTNYKTDEIDGFDSMTEEEQTKAMKGNSLFLKDLSDDVIYDLFVNRFIRHLASTNVLVYTPEYMDEYMKHQNKVYANMAQIELEEYYDVMTDERVIFDKKYVHDTYVDAFAVNLWVGVPKDGIEKVLYACNRVTDYHKGWFYAGYYEDDVMYEESNINLDLEYVERFITLIADRYAEYLYAYFMTDYVRRHDASPVSEQLPDTLSLHYSFNGKMIYTADETYRFVQ
ncbi:MAG: hypothetical protein PHR20_03965 [Bacteroidales bacterium]|nr:hypothetical protein [Bacteroidales bacterium]